MQQNFRNIWGVIAASANDSIVQTNAGQHQRNQQAFSLVELSIVLVILGLLTGGILAGQNLIRAAELRSISTQFQSYQTATQTFRDKYFALPGDFKSATKFWGDNATECADATITNGVPGTCNGNGDGLLGVISSNVSSEEYQYWNQLSLAGLIEGSYTGVGGASGDPVIAENVPPAKLSNAFWRARNFDNSGASLASAYQVDMGNVIHLSSSGSSSLAPEELWNIDIKLDDGLPARGKLWARPWNSNCTTSTSATDFSGEYNLIVSSKECDAYFAKPF